MKVEIGRERRRVVVCSAKDTGERRRCRHYHMLVFRRWEDAGETEGENVVGRWGSECGGGSMDVRTSVLVSCRLIALPSGWVGDCTDVDRGCLVALT